MKCKAITSIEIIVFLVLILAIPSAHSQSFNVIYSFAGSGGNGPLAGLAMDAHENLYGTASDGGQFGFGVVFKASRAGQEMVLHNFAGGASDGANPQGSVVFDSAGNFYGTTYAGGTSNYGIVFKMSPQGVEHILHSFTGGNDGANPIAGLTIDKNGNLYGTTSVAGASGGGTVFKIAAAGHYSVLYSFGGGSDGIYPNAGVTLDAKGNLYGTASAGGTYGYGTVFQLKPSSSGWTETILHYFQNQSDGGTPYAGLILNQGILYGAATQENNGDGGGTIFELTPSGSNWNFSVIYSLAGWNISGPFRNLYFDPTADAIYGTTHCDGAYDSGTVYQLKPGSGSWSYTELYTFTGGTDGRYVFSNIVVDKSGYLYGTTNMGGANGMGVIFQVKP
jgi:uncharacterized repeat protein (TIGR03803 family)